MHLARTVAVRILEPSASAKEREKLFGEARLLDRVRHRGVVALIDVGESPEGEPYLATDAMAGRPLDGVLAVRGALAADEAVPIALDVADALGHAHALGVAHLGLAPASILLATRPGAARASPPAPNEAPGARAKLLDFGLSPSPTGGVSGPLSALGYASPERLAGGEADARNDVHAVGALLFEMLTGELPGRGAEAPVPAPPRVVDVIRRALAPRERRYANASELAAALRDAIAAEALPASVPPRQRRAHPRAAYVTPVRVRRSNGTAIDGRTEDISEGGLLVLLDAELEPREPVLVRFALPASGRMVSVPAQARWARESRASTRAVGLAFVDAGEKVLEDIRAYVAYLGQ